MQRIILDTNFIIKYPELLSLDAQEYHPVVTLEVMQELQSIKRTSWGKKLADIIEAGHEKGQVTIVNPFTPRHKNLEQRYVSANLSLADASLLFAAESMILDHPDDLVSIATGDKDVIRLAESNGIAVLTKSPVSDLLKKQPEELSEVKSSLSNDVRKHQKLQTLNFWVSLISAVTALLGSITSLQNIIVSNRLHLSDGAAETLLFLFFITLGVFFYFCRERYRLFYGMFEFLGGVAVIFFVFRQDNFHYTALFRNVDWDFKVLGGLYIIVRGMDNIHKGTAGTKTGLWFDEVFSGLKAAESSKS